MTEKKKPRTIYTPQQICFLEEKFSEKDFPSKSQRKKWADQLQLSEQHVQIWFQNKRAKQKRKQKIRAKTEKQVHMPKPPSFWPQNLSFDSSLQVIGSDVNATPSRNSECKNKSSTAVKSVIYSEKECNKTDHHPRDTTVASFDENTQAHTVATKRKNGHQMQFFSSGYANGLSSPVSVSLQTITFKPEVVANPLLLLASCATQLHKAHATLPTNKKKPTESQT